MNDIPIGFGKQKVKKNQDIYSSFNVMTIWFFSFLKSNFEFLEKVTIILHRQK